MKISEMWLREWIDTPIDRDHLIDVLVQAGIEVETATPVCAEFTGVVVAKILAVEPHPNADRLRVCTVDTGTAHLKIVCGAKNAAVGLKVPAALVGAELPQGLTIKASQLRGVDSFGMLCAAEELGLVDDAEGLFILPDDAPVGKDLATYLQLSDHILDISLTPNRGDCLSVLGLARELAAFTQSPMKRIHCDPVPPAHDQYKNINLNAPEACPFYAGRIIQHINPAAKTPLWMKEKLRRSGIRPVHPVVDVTQYVMLELGQPLHAFDLNQLSGDMVIRWAKTGESLHLLEGKTVTLEGNTLVIADQDKPLAIAGIMGGEVSSVKPETVDIFLESAFFEPLFICGRARQYGLHTEASHRFERGVDPSLPIQALERATALLVSIVGGKAGLIVQAKSPDHLPKKLPILLTLAHINSALGVNITGEFLSHHLPLLGLSLTVDVPEVSWRVSVPAHRFDISIEADLIEEIARLYGYDAIPYALPAGEIKVYPQPETAIQLIDLKKILCSRGYSEAITYSFVDPDIQALFDPQTQPYRLVNPISNELSVMRTSLWQSLMSAYQQNMARQVTRLRLFEEGLRFIPHATGLKQIPTLAALISGSRYPEQWGLTDHAVDFYDLKQDVEALLALRHDDSTIEWLPADLIALHPGRSAVIKSGKTTLGYAGEIHPRIMADMGLKAPVYLLELDLSTLTQAILPAFQSISKYPAIRRDLCILIDKHITIDQLKTTFFTVCGSQLIDSQLFDVYHDQLMGEGVRSLAFGLIFQDPDRTLVDEEIATKMQMLIETLSLEFGAVLRQ